MKHSLCESAEARAESVLLEFNIRRIDQRLELIWTDIDNF